MVGQCLEPAPFKTSTGLPLRGGPSSSNVTTGGCGRGTDRQRALSRRWSGVINGRSRWSTPAPISAAHDYFPVRPRRIMRGQRPLHCGDIKLGASMVQLAFINAGRRTNRQSALARIGDDGVVPIPGNSLPPLSARAGPLRRRHPRSNSSFVSNSANSPGMSGAEAVFTRSPFSGSLDWSFGPAAMIQCLSTPVAPTCPPLAGSPALRPTGGAPLTNASFRKA